MGNETSQYHDVTLGDQYDISGDHAWVLLSGSTKSGEGVSVFLYKNDKTYSDYVENAVKLLKVFRHPGILKFLGYKKSSDGYLVITEKVTPLMYIIEDLSPGEICAGLHNILEALIFLHKVGNSCHNNVSTATIFVNEEGSWLLGGLEYMCTFSKATNNYLQKCKPYRVQEAVPPEEKASKVEASDVFGCARDTYAFGVIVDQLLEHLSDLGDLVKTFEMRIQDDLLNENPHERVDLSELLEDKLFQNDFVQILNFLKQVTLKSEVEKTTFFRGLAERLYDLPVEVIATRLVRPLLARFVLLDATADEYLAPYILTPYKGTKRASEFQTGDVNPLLPESLFRKYVIPELFKIFHVRDAHIRKVLLKYFPCYVEQFDRQTLRTVILPQLLLGLRDEDDELVASSLHCLADLVPVVGADVVIGANRSRVFSAGVPKFVTANGIDKGIDRKNGTKVEKNEKKKNVQSNKVLKIEEKSSSGKTLKDLAREADKQQRREEARRRAEERKKKRDEAMAKRVYAPTVPTTAVVTSEEAIPRRSVDESEVSVEVVYEEETIVSDREDEQWEGWGDEDTETIDSEIDREIEKEINAMDSTVTPKVSTSEILSDTNTHEGNIALNHSSSQDALHHKKGILKLKSPKTRTSPPPHKQTQSGGGEPDSYKKPSPNRKHISGDDNIEEEFQAKTKISPKKPAPPGSEFDILTMDIKTSKAIKVEEEPDFFADMAPVIKSEDTLMKLLAGGSLPNETQETSKKSSTKTNFAMMESGDQLENEGGWGDDFDGDWDVEES